MFGDSFLKTVGAIAVVPASDEIKASGHLE
jgi:hypothetical protein